MPKQPVHTLYFVMPAQIPAPITTATPAQNAPSPGSDDTPPASPTVPAALSDVQNTLLSLEYSLRNLTVIATDVQAPSPHDPPQGRVAEKVNQVIAQLAELDAQKESLTQNIPFDVVLDIDNNRNPNRTAKDRIENTAVQNQFVNAQILAVRSYRSLLKDALIENFPELAPHLDVSKAEDRREYELRFGRPTSKNQPEAPMNNDVAMS
ncbi:hypothetical protein FRC02_010129 [Tulasnella sp. 418]|nr:hypothetical protein FRC02_010129 [Tulasnella sp. 418]